MNKDYSLIDANLARVKEGLRVLEDIVRFVFADKELFEALKILRHSLSQTESWFGKGHVMQGRFGTDVGTDFTDKREYRVSETDRASLYSLVRANANRVTEALRLLEEYAKVYTRENSVLFQKARYQVYAVERDLIIRTPHYYLHHVFEEGVVYPFSDSIDDLKDYIDAGAKMVQLRDRDGSKDLVYQKGKELCRFVQKRYALGKEKVLLIVNDHVDIAERLPVDGIHLGQDGEQIGRIRKILGTNKIIGQSVSTYEQAEEAVNFGADYIGIGPIFETSNKPEATVVDFEIVKKIQKNIVLPWCVIGGIDTHNIHDLHKKGIYNVAVIRSAKDFFEKK